MGKIVVIQQSGSLDLNSPYPFRSVTKAEHRQDMLSSDEININFESTEPVTFYIGDKLEYENRFYKLNYAPRLSKVNDSLYIYDITFEGIRFDLKKKIYFNFDGINQTDFDFPLTGEIDTFLNALINNANLIEPGFSWSIGAFPENTEAKTITFSNENCLSALQRICEAYGTEFEIIENIASKTAVINVKSIGNILPYTFEYGYGKGLYTLKRDNINTDGLITRLYVYGSSENIPTDYRGFSNRLKLPAAYEKDYIQNDQKIANFGLIEGVKLFDDTKPNFTGIISAVGSLVGDLQSFSVSNMAFDLNEKDLDGNTKYLIPGNPAKIHVNKGNLAGYDFEINAYDHATKTLKIKQFADERGQKFPDPGTIFTFAVTDEFTFSDIIMPQIYITEAEEKLLIDGQKAYDKLSKNNVQYTIETDPDFFSQIGGENTKFLGIGDKVRVKDEELGVDSVSRIINLVRDLLNPFEYQISISDTFEINIVKQFIDEIKETQTEIKVVTQNNTQTYLNAYKLQKELRESIFDPNGFLYTELIQPMSIRTLYLETGDDSQQILYDNVTFSPNFGGNKNALKISAGDITHLLVNETPTTWGMLEYNEVLPDDAKYYIYAKCSRNNSVGSYLVTKTQISFNSDPNSYIFLLALLHSPLDGVRTITLLDGTTTIQGGYIRTKKISSIDGSTWFDLDLGAFDLGGTAGMTGRGDLNDVFFWGGGTFAGRETAKRTIHRNGVDRWRHPNGVVGFEIGIIDGILTLNGFSTLGTKLFELDPNRGLVNVGYIPQSWYLKYVFYTGQTNETLNTSAAITMIETQVLKTFLKTYVEKDDEGLPHSFADYELYLEKNTDIWDYFKGNNPDHNATVNGYVSTADGYVFCANGWYVMEDQLIKTITIEGGSPTTTITSNYTLSYINNGQITNTQTITITK